MVSTSIYLHDCNDWFLKYCYDHECNTNYDHEGGRDDWENEDNENHSCNVNDNVRVITIAGH